MGSVESNIINTDFEKDLSARIVSVFTDYTDPKNN